MYTLPEADLKDIANRLMPLWPKQSSFLIAGGTGFFGRWLVEAISFLEKEKSSGNQFYILTRQSPSEIEKKIPCLKEPYFHCLQQDLQKSLSFEFKFDYVLHAATDVSNLKSKIKTADFISIEDSGTQNLLTYLKQQNVRRLLYVSSGAVYSNEVDKACFENDLVQLTKLNPYASLKKKSEDLILDYKKNYLKSVCVARCFSFLGPYADPHMVAMQMLGQKVQNKKIDVLSPEAKRSFMYPSDLVVALFVLLFSELKHTIYNVGSSQEITLKDLAVKIDQLKNPLGVNLLNNGSNNSLAGQFYYPNTDRLLSEFKNIFTIDLQTALNKTYYELSESKLL